jgi:hypothetical protein
MRGAFQVVMIIPTALFLVSVIGHVLGRISCGPTPRTMPLRQKTSRRRSVHRRRRFYAHRGTDLNNTYDGWRAPSRSLLDD